MSEKVVVCQPVQSTGSSKRGRKPAVDGVSKSAKLSQSSAKNIPVVYEKPFVLPSVALSAYDKASQLTLSRDQLICNGCEGGYRMVRATHGVHIGAYFWEAEILAPLGPDAHVRIGWSTRQGELQSSVGFDKYGFGYRDISGSKVHNSQRIDGFGEPFGPGDIIGCFIYLDDNSVNNRMNFYKNGVDQGIAYSGSEIPTGIYFPSISLYMKAVVRVNFGPTFIIKYDVAGVNPVSELQPMNPEDRVIHEKNIQSIRQSRELQAQNQNQEPNTNQSSQS